jgi:hypothetical protein
MLPRLFLFSVFALGIEVGLFLVALPWSSRWEHNYFVYRFPELWSWLRNYYLRGMISGLGLVDIGITLAAAARFQEIVERWKSPASTPSAATISGAPPAESSPRDQTA